MAKANPAAKPADRHAAAPRQAAPAARQAAPRRAVAQRGPVRGAARQQVATARHGDVRTQRSGLVVRGAAAATISRESAASCTRRNGRTTCGQRDGVAGWQAGLPPVDYAQQSCPAGTFATLARGHDDVVRCMPI
ncbi:hypothetical protein [Falsiroseomonas sp. CW058]|uniref:hypothetical protein n=1 Tax=Falsiroseomonas sp. CW058 TaxID=3388664 RepID=UPI003D31902E